MDLQQIDTDYRRDGIVRVRSLFDAAELSEIRTALERYHREVLSTLPTGDYTLEADGSTVRNLWRMQHHDPFFEQLSQRPELLELVGPLVGGNPVVMGVETFNKPAHVGSEVPYHQDNAYFCLTPPDVLTLWMAIDPATHENGAVQYLCGSHRELMPHKPSGVKGNSYGLAEQPVEGQHETFDGLLDPGDALIHHGQVLHRSRPNQSDQARLGLIVVYRGAHTVVDETAQAEYHRALAITPQNA